MTTQPRESRQARRFRERQERKSPPVGGTWSSEPYMLICRCEDEGSGFFVFVGVYTPAEGETLARDIQRESGLPTNRCELVENTDAAIQRWAGSSSERRKQLARFSEDRRGRRA